jgi:hypothetical protein
MGLHVLSLCGVIVGTPNSLALYKGWGGSASCFIGSVVMWIGYAGGVRVRTASQ